MSVSSKALRFAVLTSVGLTVVGLSGCAAQSSSVAMDKTVQTTTTESETTLTSDTSTSDSGSTQETASASVTEDSQAADASKAAATAPALRLNNLSFSKDSTSPGEVKITLNDPAAFELRRTAPTEYALTIPGATASERTLLPQIAPKTSPGIRSARAAQTDEGVVVRMFVDGNMELRASSAGRDIKITASPIGSTDETIAAQPDARGQLAGEEATDDAVARQNPTGIGSDDGSKTYTGRLISLDLQDTNIDNALRIIAEVSNLNIIASDDVTGKLTLRLIDVPWDQALDVILKTNGLDQVTEGNVIRIAPVAKLRAEREALLEARRAKEQLEELSVRYIRVSYARVQDMREQVESVLSERGSVAVDERTNQLIIKDIRKGHDSAMDLISKLDLRTPQVLLETQIVESNRGITRDLGFQWNYSHVQSPETGNATGRVFPNSISVAGATRDADSVAQMVNFGASSIDASAGSAIGFVLDSADGSRSLAARLSALESEGRVKVISRPQIATVNNKQAHIKSVETMRIPLPSSGLSVATGAGATASGGATAAVEEIDIGIQLRVTPQASPDYYVLLDIEAESSGFGERTVQNIPSTLERAATSTVLVKSGQTFALGGVYRINDTDRVDGVPFLKDIPFFGAAFRRSFVDKGDEELIFFLTPHIVEGSFDTGAM